MRGPITRAAVTVALLAALLTPAVAALGAGRAGAVTGGCSGDRVISLGVELMARPGHDTHTIQLTTPIAAGEWRVVVHSSDGGDGRAGQTQPQEQWLLTIGGGPTVGPTTDLVDGVNQASVTDDLGAITLAGPADTLTLRHVRKPVQGGTDSVIAECVGLRRVGVVQPPAPPTSAAPPSPSTPPGTAPPSTPPPTSARPTPPTTAVPAPPAIAVVAAVHCGSATLEVVIGNQGRTPARIDLAVPRGGVVNDLVVAPGSDTTARVVLDAGFEDTTVVVRVTDAGTGAVLATTTLPVDCLPEPAPTVATELHCDAGELVVTLGNDQGPAVELTVIHERVEALEPVTVGAGDEVDVALAVVGPDLALRVVDGAGDDVRRDTVDTPCPGPDPLAGADAEGRADATTGGSGADDPDTGSTVDDATSDVDGPVALHTTVEVGCDARRAQLTMRRGGPGDERVVVLVDDDPLLVVDLVGDRPVTVEVDVTGAGELSVARPEVDDEEPIVHDVSCRGDDGVAAQLASGLVVVAVLASAVAILPRRHREITLDP